MILVIADHRDRKVLSRMRPFQRISGHGWWARRWPIVVAGVWQAVEVVLHFTHERGGFDTIVVDVGILI